MDPSAIKCMYKNSFVERGEIPIKLHTYITGKDNNNKVVKKLVSDGTEKILVVDTVNTKNKKLTDPFYGVSYKPFMGRDSITLSNIDAVFNFSKHTSGYILKQENKNYTFATMDDGPGEFTEYIFFRNPNSYGYGMTPITNPYNKDAFDPTRFNITCGESGTGNLKKDYKSFVEYIKTREVVGLDLVVGNDRGNDGYMVKLIVALNVIRIGGTFISKISNINSPLIIDLLYITSRCFNKITLFKPISTDINNDTYYIIAEESKTNNIEWISYLENSYAGNVHKLLTNIPEHFMEWITEYNNLILLYKKYLTVIKVDELYDTYKCKAIWNLP